MKFLQNNKFCLTLHFEKDGFLMKVVARKVDGNTMKIYSCLCSQLVLILSDHWGASGTPALSVSHRLCTLKLLA